MTLDNSQQVESNGKSENEHKRLDGGFGWIVVLGSFFIYFIGKFGISSCDLNLNNYKMFFKHRESHIVLGLCSCIFWTNSAKVRLTHHRFSV